LCEYKTTLWEQTSLMSDIILA